MAGVCALVTRAGPGGAEVLVTEHPSLGTLLPPAGADLATVTGLADVDVVGDLDPRLRHVHVRQRLPDEWWVLVDEGGGACYHCHWLPVDEAARLLPGRPEALDAIAARPGPDPARLPPLLGGARGAPGAVHVAWRSRWFLQRWLPGADAAPARAQAFSVTPDGDAVLVSSDPSGDGWGLPGGGIEPGEGAFEALEREMWEETCGRVVESQYLGAYELVEPLSGSSLPEYQAKFWARVELGEWAPRFEIVRLKLVPYRDVPSLLTAWRQPAAATFLAAGVAAEDARRAASGPHPLVPDPEYG